MQWRDRTRLVIHIEMCCGTEPIFMRHVTSHQITVLIMPVNGVSPICQRISVQSSLFTRAFMSPAYSTEHRIGRLEDVQIIFINTFLEKHVFIKLGGITSTNHLCLLFSSLFLFICFFCQMLKIYSLAQPWKLNWTTNSILACFFLASRIKQVSILFPASILCSLYLPPYRSATPCYLRQLVFTYSMYTVF